VLGVENTEETAVAETEFVYVDPHQDWSSQATRDVSTATFKQLKYSPRRLAKIAKMIRYLSVDEAITQLKFCPKQKPARMVTKVLKNAVIHAQNNFHMDRSRLYVSMADVMKGQYKRQLIIKAKGQAAIRFKNHAHLRIGVREQPWEEGEKRIGRSPGRTKSKIAETDAHLKKIREAEAVVKRAARAAASQSA